MRAIDFGFPPPSIEVADFSLLPLYPQVFLFINFASETFPFFLFSLFSAVEELLHGWVPRLYDSNPSSPPPWQGVDAFLISFPLSALFARRGTETPFPFHQLLPSRGFFFFLPSATLPSPLFLRRFVFLPPRLLVPPLFPTFLFFLKREAIRWLFSCELL